MVSAYLGGEQDQRPEINFAPVESEAGLQSTGLYNSKSQATTTFSAIEPILIKCSFKVRREIEGLQLSFAVLNFKHERVFYSTISMADPPISVEAAGDHNILARIPGHLLLPGRYSVTIALHTPKTKLYDIRRQALNFRIIPTMADRYDGFSGDDLGQVYADVKWQKVDQEIPIPHSKPAMV